MDTPTGGGRDSRFNMGYNMSLISGETSSEIYATTGRPSTSLSSGGVSRPSMLPSTCGAGIRAGVKRPSEVCFDQEVSGRPSMASQSGMGMTECGSDIGDDSFSQPQKKTPPPNGKKTKGRVKIKMEYIDNKLRRYTTFSKRKTGIMKKLMKASWEAYVQHINIYNTLLRVDDCHLHIVRDLVSEKVSALSKLNITTIDAINWSGRKIRKHLRNDAFQTWTNHTLRGKGVIVYSDLPKANSWGLMHHEFIPEGRTVTKELYVETLRRLWDAVRRKRPEKWVENNWFLMHDNAPAHRAIIVKNFLARHNITALDHPPYSPDLSPPDYFLFPRPKSHLKGRRFNAEVVIANAMRALRRVSQNGFQACFQELYTRWQKCVVAEGNYFEGIGVE
ncbi:hypothetical protein ANN_24134 [Periplaneta americana]|uniref:MADS-box domain-containing protein n=1 Tax=Periplaneta americana TaxID=6978 RepID=A0ABQ8S2P0_PERAM|nr:hypothetical protein ANN_24134 [Periplaneta americana]